MNWVQPAKRRACVKTPRSEWLLARSEWLLALPLGVFLLISALQVAADETTWHQALPPGPDVGHVIEVLDDRRMDGIRGKFMPGGAETIESVILWDEGPGGLGHESGGRGNSQENHHSQGFGNDQVTSVTTRRSHSP